MSALTRARRVSSDLLRRVGRRAASTRLGRRVRRPAVSVVVVASTTEVPSGDREAQLSRCLESLRNQSFGDFEVLVVGGSLSPGLTDVLSDNRVRHLRLAVDDVGTLLNHGMANARGRWLYFMRPQDEATPRALTALVTQARLSGSPIVCGARETFDAETSGMPRWSLPVYETPRSAVALTDFPLAVRDASFAGKLIERTALDGVSFPSGVEAGTRRVVMALLAASPQIDLLPEVVGKERVADGQAVLSNQTITVEVLTGDMAVLSAEARAVAEFAPAVRREWAAFTFEFALVRILSTPSIGQDDYWAVAERAVRELTEHGGEEVWAQLPPGVRVLLALARAGRRDDVAEFVRRGAVKGVGRFGTLVRAEGLEVQLPFLADPDLDRSLFLLRPEQLTARHAIDRLSWTAESFEMSGWAFIDHLDLHEVPSHVDVVLIGRQTGVELAFAARDEVAVGSAAPVNEPTADISRATFAVSVATSTLLQSEDRAWDVAVRITAAGFTVTEAVRHLVRSGSAGSLMTNSLPDGTGLALRWRYRHPLHLALDGVAVRVEDLALVGRRLRGRLVDPQERVAVVELTGTGLRTATPQASGRFEIEIPAGKLRVGRPTTATLGACSADGSRIRLEAIIAPMAANASHAADGSVLVVGRASNGAPNVAEWSLGAEGIEVRVTEVDGVQVSGRAWSGAAAAVHSVQLLTQSAKASSQGPVVAVTDGGDFVATLDLQQEVHRYGRWPLPSAEHVLRVRLLGADGEELGQVPLSISAPLNATLPIAVRTDRLEGRVLRGADGGTAVLLERPLGDMASSYRQEKLRRRAAEAVTGTATRRGILFRSYFGERATDNGLSIGQELQRRRSDLPIFWAVQDHSVPVPQGTTAVVVNSQEWFDLLREVTYYVDNMYQPEYHHRPEGQVIVQTFHGYPFKLMGRQNWNRLQISSAQVDEYLRRGAEWDHLVSPARYATPLLVRDFEYTGDVLEIGYPRNDVLLSPEADEIRRATRESLGVREDQTVVLYAPTFREARATGHSKALLDDFFDFDEFAAAFGDSAVVLMRGHAFHARTSQRVGDNHGVIDVTDYPEVSDLLLAADVCVADYSSLRFDFAVTGKPMVFLVPDLEDYVADRGWLLDFPLTAPGPLVQDTRGIIEAVRDLPALRDCFAAQYAQFRNDFLDLEDGHAGARFVDAVLVPRGDAPPA